MSLRRVFSVIRALRAWGMLTCWFGGESPVFGQPWHHVDMTKEAAAAVGWSMRGGEASPVSSLAWHCLAVDDYNYNPLWWTKGGWDRFHMALLHKAELDKLHFDDVTSTRQAAVVWNRYLGGTVAGLLWAADHDDVTAARAIVGACLHALQDFYSHSNWVDAPARRRASWADMGPSSIPAINDSRLALQLYTGAYNAPEQLSIKPHGKYSVPLSLLHLAFPVDLMDLMCASTSRQGSSAFCREWTAYKQGHTARIPLINGVAIPEGVVYLEPAGMALDASWMKDIATQVRDVPDKEHLSDDLFEVARTLAVSASSSWLRELDAIMGRAGHVLFWNRVKTEQAPSVAGTGADLQQYENPWRLPFGFLSAGRYPPDPGGSDEGWYLRVEASTVDQTFAGTDADITLEVSGKSFILDHMRERTPGGGILQNRLLEWNDFEAGSHDTYLVGPIATLPTSVALRNTAASLGDVLATAWNGFLGWVGRTLNDLGTTILSIWGGNADRVGADQRYLDWYQLRSIAGQTQFDLHAYGGDEGTYTITLGLTVAAAGDDLRATLSAARLRCDQESRQDQLSSSDEPFFFLLAHSAANRETRTHTYGPFSGVDTGETRTPDGSTLTVTIPHYGGLIIAMQMWESDNENQRMRDDAERVFRTGLDRADVNERSALLDAMGRMIAPDWKVAGLDVTAFRRGPTTELAPLVRDRTLNTWVEAGRTLAVPCDPRRIITATANGVPLPAGTVSMGGTVLLGNCAFDFDKGVVTTGTESDVLWQHVDTTTRFLAPRNNATLTRLTGVTFEGLTAARLAAAPYQATPLNGSDTATNQLTSGTLLAIRTSHGNYAKARIDAYGSDLTITWVTYSPTPSPPPAPPGPRPPRSLCERLRQRSDQLQSDLSVVRAELRRINWNDPAQKVAGLQLKTQEAALAQDLREVQQEIVVNRCAGGGIE